jgi:hypothetical protein
MERPRFLSGELKCHDKRLSLIYTAIRNHRLWVHRFSSLFILDSSLLSDKTRVLCTHDWCTHATNGRVRLDRQSRCCVDPTQSLQQTDCWYWRRCIPYLLHPRCSAAIWRFLLGIHISGILYSRRWCGFSIHRRKRRFQSSHHTYSY